MSQESARNKQIPHWERALDGNGLERRVVSPEISELALEADGEGVRLARITVPGKIWQTITSGEMGLRETFHGYYEHLSKRITDLEVGLMVTHTPEVYWIDDRDIGSPVGMGQLSESGTVTLEGVRLGVVRAPATADRSEGYRICLTGSKTNCAELDAAEFRSERDPSIRYHVPLVDIETFYVDKV